MGLRRRAPKALALVLDCHGANIEHAMDRRTFANRMFMIVLSRGLNQLSNNVFEDPT